MKRFFIYISYKGSDYCGWQIQPNGMSVQRKLEDCMSTLLRRRVSLTGAGRTDAGVHALSMIAHFDWEDDREDWNVFISKLNSFLPQDIAVHKIEEVKKEAHARFSAVSRTYKYYVSLDKNPFQTEFSYRLFRIPDFGKMNEAASVLFEYEDFTSFSKLHTDTATNNCKIMEAFWTKTSPGLWCFTIKANRFLRNMVRAIVGTLLEVGWNKINLDDFRMIIEAKNRSCAGSSVPGKALFLAEIEYPSDIFFQREGGD